MAKLVETADTPATRRRNYIVLAIQQLDAEIAVLEAAKARLEQQLAQQRIDRLARQEAKAQP